MLNNNDNNNSNNPFENGNNKQNNQFDSQNEFESKSENVSSQNTVEKKQRSGCAVAMIIIGALIAIIVALVIIIVIWAYDQDSELEAIASVDIVENYTYDFNDVTSSLTENPFPSQLGEEISYSIKEDEVYTENSLGDKATTVLVGVDIEPGIYTISSQGATYYKVKSKFETYLMYKDNKTYYNIPLLEGDKIELEFWDEEDSIPGELQLTSQSEYVNFEPNINGVFVYGLNQFEREVHFTENGYELVIYGHNTPDSFLPYSVEVVFDVDLTLPGGAGTYFAVEYDSEMAEVK